MSKGKKKPQKPEWHKAAVASAGARVAGNKLARAEAFAAVADEIRRHPDYVESLIATDAKHELDRWLAGNGSSGDLLQASLFPDLPVRMRVAPDHSLEVAVMTGEQLDKARNILLAQTKNAIDGATEAAERKRTVFTAFYDRVRPLLDGDRTVADALADLAAKAA